MKPIIILPDGTPILDLDIIKPKVLGYRIIHIQTGRILPGTARNEVYTKPAAVRKMGFVASQFTIMHTQLDIWEYTIEVIYDFEKPKECVYITDKYDYLY